MTKHVCNVCGEDFDEWDERENIGLYHYCGYGSEFDGQNVQLDLCCGCFDTLMKDYLLPNCKISPLQE